MLDDVKADYFSKESEEPWEPALVLGSRSSPDEKLRTNLADRYVQAMRSNMSRLPVFSKEMGRAVQHDLGLLRVLKQLKYFWNLP